MTDTNTDRLDLITKIGERLRKKKEREEAIFGNIDGANLAANDVDVEEEVDNLTRYSADSQLNNEEDYDA